jgi:hypothetical protein
MTNRTCECGGTATQEIWNGVEYSPVCHTCWMDPENIATEVCVKVAELAILEGGQFNLPASQLPSLLAAAMADYTAESLRERGVNHDPSVAALIGERWTEWYAA